MKRRHPKEIKEPKNENGSNEIINNLINALTQTVNNKPEKDDVNSWDSHYKLYFIWKQKEKDNKILQEIYQKFLSNEEKWEERLKVIEEIQKQNKEQNSIQKDKLKSESVSPSLREAITNRAHFLEDEVENNEENHSNVKPELFNEVQNDSITFVKKIIYLFRYL